MITIEPHRGHQGAPGRERGGELVLVARAEVIAALETSGERDRLGPLACHAAAPDGAVEDDWLGSAKALVIEVEAGNAGSLERIAQVRASHPELPVIAALEATDVKLARALLRQGVNDIARLPIDCAELAEQVGDLPPPAAAAGAVHQAPLVLVTGSTGGCGTTTVLTHLAANLAEQGKGAGRVCVLDLDVQGGDVAYYVGQIPRVTVSTLLEAGDRLDAEMLQGALTDSRHGFVIVAAPAAITALDDVDQDRLLELLALVRSAFDMVLVDVPDDWSGWALSLALAADRVVLVTELSVAGLRQAKRRLDLFASVGVKSDRVMVVANRVEHRIFKVIGLDDAEEALGCPVAVSIANEGEHMVAAQNEGRLLTDLHKHSRFASDIASLARSLVLEGR